MKAKVQEKEYEKDPENFDPKFKPNCDASKQTFKHLVKKKKYMPTNLCESGNEFQAESVLEEPESLLLTATNRFH